MSETIEIATRPEEIRNEVPPSLSAALVENGVTDYSFEQCLDDYRLAMFLPLNHTMLGLTYLDFSKRRGPELAAVILERTASILQDHKVKDLFDDLADN